MDIQDTRDLNVGLSIKSRENLAPIVDEFCEDTNILANEKVGNFYYASFEIAGCRCHAGTNENIERFCSLIERLPDNIRKSWDNCSYRIFEIGYELGNSKNSYSSDLRPEVIKSISKINASIQITIYPYYPPTNGE